MIVKEDSTWRFNQGESRTRDDVRKRDVFQCSGMNMYWRVQHVYTCNCFSIIVQDTIHLNMRLLQWHYLVICLWSQKCLKYFNTLNFRLWTQDIVIHVSSVESQKRNSTSEKSTLFWLSAGDAFPFTHTHPLVTYLIINLAQAGRNLMIHIS